MDNPIKKQELADVLTDQQYADICRQYVDGELTMGYVLKLMNLPSNRAQQAAYKMVVAWRRFELAKKGIILR